MGPPPQALAGPAAIVSAVVVLVVSYFAGGYVAGRMARFNGPKQGLGVWAIGILVTILLAVLGTVLGSQYDLLAQLKLPSIPVDAGTASIGGLVALAAVLIGTLIASMGGGKVGTRYHRKVDRVE